MAVTVDEMLEKIGSFERYQWMLLCICGYALMSADTFQILIATFITAEPNWICVKGYHNSVCNFTEPITLTSKNYNARCTMPREAWTYVDDFTSTVTEFDLVCNKSYLLSVAQSCFWVGMFVGLLIGGFLSDRYGRKTIYYSGCVGVLLATWVTVFPKYFAAFIACRTFSGLLNAFIVPTGCVLLSEFTGKMHRATISITSFCFWVIGLPILAVLAYFIRNWRHLLLATAISATPLIFIWWFVPESARWLLLHGKPEKAKEQLIKVARINGKPFPQDELKQPELEERGNYGHLFFNMETTKRTLISWDIWLTTNLVYYGVSYATVDLGWNRYLTFGLTSIIELPATFLSIWILNRFGRKKPIALGFLISSISLVIAASIPYDGTTKVSTWTILRIITALIAKISIYFCFASIYVWNIELFPTSIRNIALSTSSSVGRIGSFTTSYVIWLIRVHPMLPFGIMALMCFKSAILSMLLPDTNGQPTMETMSEICQKQEILLVPSLEKESDINLNKRHLGEMYLENQLFCTKLL